MLLLPSLCVIAYFTTYAILRSQLPPFALHFLSAKNVSQETHLPFFSLMLPIPSLDKTSYIPKLEYQKGPPKRFLSKISYLVKRGEAEEKIVFYGQRTQKNLLFWNKKIIKNPYPKFLKNALHYAHDASRMPPMGYFKRPFARLLFLLQAKKIIKKNDDVYIMNQAGVPAFLFLSQPSPKGVEAKMWFFRKNTLHEVKMYSRVPFSILQPKKIFQKSFLIQKRKHALNFLSRHLTKVKINKIAHQNSLRLKELQWPLLLLGANLSIEPSSIHTFFHFAGLNALLFNRYRHTDKLRFIDNFRNNVLVADRYGKDIAPQSLQSAKMSHMARALLNILY